MSDVDALTPGFADPILQTQKAFRLVLDAWARPGRQATLHELNDAPPSLGTASAIIALTFVDQDTSVWLSEQSRPAADWLRFHCGCPIVDRPDTTAFAFLQAGECPPLSAFNAGTALSPEFGATLVIRVASLSNGRKITLSGPGIETTDAIAVDGLPERILSERRDMKRLYPAGLDFMLASGTDLLCLPRTTRLEWE